MKEELRRLARQLSKDIKQDWHTEASASVCSRLYEYLSQQDYQTIGLYMPMADEVDVQPLLSRLREEGKEIYLPRVVDRDRISFIEYGVDAGLEVNGIFNLREPALGQGHIDKVLDVLVIPAVHFYNNYRLGRGKAYYDKYLALYRPKKMIGVSLGLLRDAEFTPDPWDIPMDIVFTA